MSSFGKFCLINAARSSRARFHLNRVQSEMLIVE
jgi:hypothetical protein